MTEPVDWSERAGLALELFFDESPLNPFGMDGDVFVNGVEHHWCEGCEAWVSANSKNDGHDWWAECPDCRATVGESTLDATALAAMLRLFDPEVDQAREDSDAERRRLRSELDAAHWTHEGDKAQIEQQDQTIATLKAHLRTALKTIDQLAPRPWIAECEDEPARDGGAWLVASSEGLIESVKGHREPSNGEWACAWVEKVNGLPSLETLGDDIATEAHTVALMRRHGDRLRGDAVMGAALRQLGAQIDRLRVTRCPTMGFGFGADDIINAMRSELVELEAEDPGSERAQAESVDAFTVGVHLTKVHGTDLLAAMRYSTDKLRRRLDHVDAGGTWAEAKALEGQP